MSYQIKFLYICVWKDPDTIGNRCVEFSFEKQWQILINYQPTKQGFRSGYIA